MSETTGDRRFRRARVCVLALAFAGLLAPHLAARTQPGAPALVREIEQGAASVRVELRAARDANDPARARCVSGKLSEVHAQLRLARQHATELASARGAHGRRHRYLLEVAHERAHELAQAARRCDTARTSFVRVVRR